MTEPPAPYEVVRDQLANLIANVVKAEIPVTQAEFTSAFLASAAEGAVLQGLPLEQFAALATHFYQDALAEIEAAGIETPA